MAAKTTRIINYKTKRVSHTQHPIPPFPQQRTNKLICTIIGRFANTQQQELWDSSSVLFRSKHSLQREFDCFQWQCLAGAAAQDARMSVSARITMYLRARAQIKICRHACIEAVGWIEALGLRTSERASAKTSDVIFATNNWPLRHQEG